MITFTRATRSQVPLKLGITGPSGSGKTTAALKLARGLVGPGAPIALLDTEGGSASLYSDTTEFDVLNMNPPYQVAKFTGAMEAAVQAGYKALIIDSATHEWKELLAEKEALDARGGNSYVNWFGITKKHETFLTAIQNVPIHLIVCLRSKDKHEIVEKDGKKSVVKLGQGSEMRDGFEYQLTTVWDLAMDHNASVSKDRTRAFDGRLEQVTEATGRELAAWLASGKPLAENTGEAFPSTTPAPATATNATASPAATVGTGAAKPGAQSAAQPAAQGAKPAPTNQAEPDPILVELIALLAAATLAVEMPEKSRTALINYWMKEGPNDLDGLRQEIKTQRSLIPNETVQQSLDASQADALARKDAPGQAATTFVDGLECEEENGGISPEQYQALNHLIGAFNIDRNALRLYCDRAGHLLPGKNGPTLARLKSEAFTKLRDRLLDKTLADKKTKVTKSQRTVEIINATQPMPLAS